jgi:nucleoside-diphosphate-sugar epimerase
MRIIVIGGTGHIGTYLVPRLVLDGHEVIVIARGQRSPYQDHPTWKEVRKVIIDRESAEKEGRFGRAVLALKPDAVMDMTCFTVESAQQLVEPLKGEIQFFAHCGTIWVRGWGSEVPAREEHLRNPLTDYGVKKNQIEAYLLEQARRFAFPATALHPGHIVGPGWEPVGPTACHDLEAIGRCIRGEELILPNLGMETVHHVHASDVAQAFYNSLTHWNEAVGEGFFIVSPAAMTLRGFAEGLAQRFGRTAKLRYLPFEEWKKTIPPDFVESAVSHATHSSNASIAKATARLEYHPHYSSLDAVEESVRWLINAGRIIWR